MDMIICLIGLLVIVSSAAQECGEAHMTATSEFRYLTFRPNSSTFNFGLFNCTWTIEAEDNSRKVYADVLMSNIGITSSRCFSFSNRVTAYDGSNVSSEVIRTWCKDETPIIKSTGRYLTFLFKLSYLTGSIHFKLKYRQTSGPSHNTSICIPDSLVAAETAQILTSPDYPHHSKRDVDCTVTITGTNGSYIKLIGSYAEMRSSCNFEILRIYEGTSVKGFFIGNVCESGRKRFTVVSTGHTVTVRYKTDVSNDGRGFMLTYKSEYLGDRYVCGNSNMIPSSSSQEISSPFYPNNYPNNTLCSWSITTADFGTGIVIKITDLDIENSLNCAADFLEIFDYDMSLGKWCGTLPPAELTSGPHTMITFRSDGGISKTGFKLQYTLTQNPSSQSTFRYWAWLGTAFAIVILTCIGCCCVCGVARKRRRRGQRQLNQSIPAPQQLVYSTDRDQPAQNTPPSTFPPPPSYDEVITKDQSEPLPPPYSSLNDLPNLQR